MEAAVIILRGRVDILVPLKAQAMGKMSPVRAQGPRMCFHIESVIGRRNDEQAGSTYESQKGPLC